MATPYSDLLPMVPDVDGLPPELLRGLERHQQNLTALVASLRAAGLDESMIDMSVGTLVESYRIELTQAMHSLKVSPQSEAA